MALSRYLFVVFFVFFLLGVWERDPMKVNLPTLEDRDRRPYLAGREWFFSPFPTALRNGEEGGHCRKWDNFGRKRDYKRPHVGQAAGSAVDRPTFISDFRAKIIEDEGVGRSSRPRGLEVPPEDRRTL